MNELNVICSPSKSVDYFTCESESLVITFGFYGQNKLTGMGWGGAELFADGFDILAVKTLANDWYQCFKIEDFNKISIFLSTKIYKKRIAYGTSMGGYASILFSKFVKLDEIICFSPQYSIWESWDLRWSGEARMTSPQKYDLKKIHSSDVLCKIAYDPYDIDKIHFNKISKIFKNLVEYRMPNFGHPVVVCLADNKKLKDFNHKILFGTANYSVKELHDIRKNSSFHKYNLAKKLKSSQRYNCAFNIIRKLNIQDNVDYGKLYVELGIRCELKNTISYVHELVLAEKSPCARIYLNILNINLDFILSELAKLPGGTKMLFELIGVRVSDILLKNELANFVNVFSTLISKIIENASKRK